MPSPGTSNLIYCPIDFTSPGRFVEFAPKWEEGTLGGFDAGLINFSSKNKIDPQLFLLKIIF